MGAIAIIQARMGSERLPGKVLRPLGGRPVLSWVIRAARIAGVFDAVIVATTRSADDAVVLERAREEGVEVFRGATSDVLTRFVDASSFYAGDPIVRLTADCPLLDPEIIAMVVREHERSDADLVTTVHPRTLPRGLDVEAFSVEALRRADSLTRGAKRAHVTPMMYADPSQFMVTGLTFSPRCDDLRVTLDTDADARLLDALVRELGDRAPAWQDVVHLLRSRPGLVAINATVRQKPLAEG